MRLAYSTDGTPYRVNQTNIGYVYSIECPDLAPVRPVLYITTIIGILISSHGSISYSR